MTAHADDRESLISMLCEQDWLDDPTAGFVDAAAFEAGSLVWPDRRWARVKETMQLVTDRRVVQEFIYTRAEVEPLEVPVAFVWDKTNEDRRARVYYNKAHFGFSEPPRPLIAPEHRPLSAALERYVSAIRAGDRGRLQQIVRPDAQIISPIGPVSAARFVEALTAEPQDGAVRGVPLQICTVTTVDEVHATEFVSWRRPPHGGLGIYTFDDGLLTGIRVYEGPVRR